MINRFRHRRDSAAPGLLVVFVSATLAMVFALVVLLRGDGDWVDFVAITLLLAVAAAVLGTIQRELDEDEPPGDETDEPLPRA
jgi:Ca2+/Na+ antiporter